MEIEKNEKIRKEIGCRRRGKSRDDKKNIRKPLWGLDLGKQSILFAGVGKAVV